MRRGNARRIRGRRKAATLIDLVLTVLTIGILASVAAPKFAATSARLRCESAARRLAADMNYARRAAILQSRQSKIDFTLVPPQYVMTNVANPYRPTEAYQVALADVDAAASFVSVNCNAGLSLAYNAYGRPLAGSPLAALTQGTITLAVGGFQNSIVIDPNSGEATVQ